MSHRSFYRKTLGLAAVGVFIVSFLGLSFRIPTVLAATGLTQKWRTALGSRAMTYVCPLAADLNNDGRLEVVVVGGSSDGGMDGTVTVLNGATGNIIWQAGPANGSSYSGIGMHTPFEIADLDGDGVLEIIVVPVGGVLALRGNNGSVYWRNNNVSPEQNYFVVFDVNGDGHPEIFVNRGYGPLNGYDRITCLDYMGNILSQAWDWHPCWGGLTLGDPNNDGQFRLYQGDRSNSYSSSDDPYKGGGQGVRCLDALTLTPIWNDPTILCSTQAPMLADVDKDPNHTLDVVVADQGSNGIAVLNATDGAVLTTRYASDGTPLQAVYRKAGLSIPSHSNPTVADVDGDGHLEMIICHDSAVYIWDLYDWVQKAVLPAPSSVFEPPKVGNVSGNSNPDIIVVSGSDIYIYNYANGNFSQVQRIANAPMWGGSAFTLVQDVDGDGSNELIVTGTSGVVLCYDCYDNTGNPVKSPTPRVRSTNQFYSERRCGSAEYVPPPVPTRPVLTNERPRNGSLNQGLNPTLSVVITDFQGTKMNISFITNATTIASYTNASSGVYSVPIDNMNSTGTQYTWMVNATDGQNATLNTYTFTTYSNSPMQNDPSLTSVAGMNTTTENLICSNQTTADIEYNHVTNIYDWYLNNNPFTNLDLSFDTPTVANPLVADQLFSDGFEYGISNWTGNGATSWDLSQNQAHSGSYSAHASVKGSGTGYLTSNTLDTSSAEGITVSFWYRDHGIGNGDNVYLRFWNGSTYNDIFHLGNTAPEDRWQQFSYQTYDRQYLIPDFRIRFDAASIKSANEGIWIDDVSITCPTRTKDYSGYHNDGTIHGATWTNQGVLGGAYLFDGINDYIRVQDDPSLGGDGTWNQITIEFWIEPLASQKGATVIAKKVAQATLGSYMVRFTSSGSANTLSWGINSTYDGIWHEISDSTTTVLPANQWSHVVCTYKTGAGLAIYVNGKLAASLAAIVGNIAPGSGVSVFGQPLFIGYDGGSGRTGLNTQSGWLNGILDEIRIYPRALSPSQIQQRYLETRDGLSGNSVIASQETGVGEVWKCQVTPNDGFGDGAPKFSNTLTILPNSTNHPPMASFLNISPSSPHATDNLTVTYSYFDSDGDPEWGTQIRWYNGSTLVPAFSDSLMVPSSLLRKYQVWTVTVTPKDGTDFGLAAQISVTILNTPPSFSSVYVAPNPAFNSSNLSASSVGWSDPEGDPEGYVYQWQKLVNGNWQNITSATSKTLSSSNFIGGDYVRILCTAYDGQDLGASLQGVRWIANFQSLANPLLVSSLGTNTTSEDLTCYNYTANQMTDVYSWYKNNVPVSNLQMPFDTNSATTAEDYSGYGNNGAIFNATWTSKGLKGGAYIFDGATSLITIPDSTSLGNDGTWSEMTIEFWINSATSQRRTCIIGKMLSNVSQGSYTVGFQSSTANALYWGITPTGGSFVDTSSVYLPILATGAWYHIVCIYKSGPGLAIYINGTQVVSSPLQGNISASPNALLYIGSDGENDPRRYFNGSLDQIRIYPKALSAAQIVQLFAEGKDASLTGSTIVSTETKAGDVWKCTVTPIIGSVTPIDGVPKSSNTLTIQSQQWSLTVSSVYGSPNPSVGSYLYGDGSSVTCNVSSPVIEGGVSYTCTGWTGTGSVPTSGSGTSVTFTITQDSTITWNWMTTQIGLLVEVTGSGTTNATGTTIYNSGTVVVVNATPASGWTLNNWFLNGTNVGSSNPYVLTMIQNYNLTVVFVQPAPIFGDSFESGNFNAWNGTFTSASEGANVVNNFSNLGSYSALFTSNGDGGFEGAYCFKTISPQTELYARGYFYISKLGIADNNDDIYFIRFRSGTNDVAYAGLRQVGGIIQWSLLIRNGTGWLGALSPNPTPSLSQWYCIELHWVESGTNGYAELYVNGIPVISITGSNTAAQGDANMVRFGLAELYNCNSTTIYGDDCRISKTYVGPESIINSTVNLGSREIGGSSTGLGSLLFGSILYGLPVNVSTSTGLYTAQYFVPNASYVFDHWEGSGPVVLSDANANPTSVTVPGDGTLTAVYRLSSSGYIFADGFESGSFTAWTNVTATSGDVTSVITTLPYQGSYSANFSSNGNGGYETAYCYQSTANLNEIYARGYFYVNASGITTNDNRFYFIILRSGSNSLAYAGWRMTGNVVSWNLIIRDGTSYVSNYSISSPALNQWYSVELHWVGNSVNGTGELYVNGTLVCSIVNRNTAALGGVSQVRFGLPEIYNCGPTMVFCDACKISTHLIGPES